MQMRAYVMRLRRRGVVHVAADVAVVVLGSDLGPRHAPAVGGNLVDVAAGQGAVGMDDARDVLGAQEVLRLDLEVVAVGVEDRKSVVGGKSVAVRVDVGGGRVIKKKKKKG